MNPLRSNNLLLLVSARFTLGFLFVFFIYISMAGKINFFSLNVGMNSNLAGLTNYLRNDNLDIIFLQEIRISAEQLSAKVSYLGYKAEVNVNEEEPSKPGTAILWKSCLKLNPKISRLKFLRRTRV